MANRPKSPSAFQRASQKASTFLHQDIWALETSVEKGFPPWGIKLARFSYFFTQEFSRNRIPSKAAALTYSTLFAIVPLLAVIIGILHTFGYFQVFVEQVQPFIFRNLTPGSGQVVTDALQQFVENIHGGAISGIGFIFLIFTTVQLLSTIEFYLNETFHVSKSRGFFRKFVIYWSALTLGTVLLMGSLSLMPVIQKFLFVDQLMQISFLSRLTVIVMPFVMSSFALTVLYLFMANTYVRAPSAIFGGVVAGVLFELAKRGYALYTAKVITYSKIYGSLGAIPVFLIWIYLTWVIVLLGAEMVYTHQNLRSFARGMTWERLSPLAREYVAVRVMLIIGGEFFRGGQYPGLEDLAGRAEVPLEETQELVNILVQGGLVTALPGEDPRFMPSRDLEKISLLEVVAAVRKCGGETVALEGDAPAGRAYRLLDTAVDASQAALGNTTLRDILAKNEG